MRFTDVSSFPSPRSVRLATALGLIAILLGVGGCTWLSPRPRGVWRALTGPPAAGEPAGSAAFEAELDRLTGAAATSGNRATLLQNGDETYPAMLAAIRAARHRISMEMYIIERDAVTGEFFDALADAAARGVEVRFAADAVGFRRGQVAHLNDLAARGVRTRVFNPLLASWTVLRFNNRNHRKILVVDGTVAFMGGLNLASEQIGNGVTGWRDTAIRVEGPAALTAEAVFAQTWRQAGRGYWNMDWPLWGTRRLKRVLDTPFVALSKAVGLRDDFVPTPLPDTAPPEGFGGETAVSVRALWTDPVELSSPIYEALLLGLSAATETADLATAYFAPPRALRRALIDAAGRGVRVRLLLPGVTDVPLARPTSEAYYGELLEAGIEIREWPYVILHAKTVVIDGCWSLVGSANWDARSFSLSYEASFAVTGKSFGGAMREAFEADWERSKPVAAAAWERRGTGKRVREALLMPLGGQF